MTWKKVTSDQFLSKFYAAKNKANLKLRSYFSSPIQIDGLIELLDQLRVPRGRPLVIHSSFSNILHAEISRKNIFNRNRDFDSTQFAFQLIDALLNFVGSDSYLAFPTEFLSDYRAPSNALSEIQILTAQSNRGYLTKVALSYPQVRRSSGPIYNVALIGKADHISVENHHKSSFAMGRGSPWSQFLIDDANILFLGCSLDSNSMIHAHEYSMGFDYPRNIFDTNGFNFKLKYGDINIESANFIHNVVWKIGQARTFTERFGREMGYLKSASIGSCEVHVISSTSQFLSQQGLIINGISWHDRDDWHRLDVTNRLGEVE